MSFLIIEGEPSAEELQAAWNEIIFEYSTLFTNEQTEAMLSLSKEIAILLHHIFFVEQTVDLLRIKHFPELVEELINLGYHGQYVFESENYNKELDRVISLCKTNVFEVSVLQDEFKKLEKTAKGKAQTEEEYDTTIAWLSKEQGYRIVQKETTVTEFVTIFNLCVKQISINNKMAQDGRR